MARKPARRLDRERELHPRLAFAAQQPCAARHKTPCLPGAQVQVCHVGIGGTSLKHGSPMDTIAMCGPVVGVNSDGHHQQFDQAKGAFAGMTRQERQDWAADRVRVLNAKWEGAK